MKNTAILIALGILPFLANAETITGQYSSNLPMKRGDVSISVKRTGKSTQPNKKGRFALRNVDVNNDTLVLHSESHDRTSYLPVRGCIEFIIKEEDNKVDIVQKKAPYEPSGMYGGQIFTKASLEKTGESMTLAAVNAKAPRSNVYTSFTGKTEPLYYIDGLEVGEIATLPLSEVAYVELVRPSNPECAAMGSRGGNGMILVTTVTRYQSEDPAWNEPTEYHWEIQLDAGK